jgi:hypothetical protein
MSKDQKKEKGLNPRVDTSKFPSMFLSRWGEFELTSYLTIVGEWLQNRTIPKSEPLEMNVPMGDKLPRVKVWSWHYDNMILWYNTV